MDETYERMLARKRKADALLPEERQQHQDVYNGLVNWLLDDCAAHHRLPVELCRLDERHKNQLVELFVLVEMVLVQPDDKSLYRAFYEALELLSDELWMELPPDEAEAVQEVFAL